MYCVLQVIHQSVAKQRQSILFAVWCRTQELPAPIRKAARQVLMRSINAKKKLGGLSSSTMIVRAAMAAKDQDRVREANGSRQ